MHNERHRRIFQNIQTTEQGTAIDRNESTQPWLFRAKLHRPPCSSLPSAARYPNKYRGQRRALFWFRAKSRAAAGLLFATAAASTLAVAGGNLRHKFCES